MPAKAEVRPSAGRCQITQDFVARKEGEDLVMELDWLRAHLGAIDDLLAGAHSLTNHIDPKSIRALIMSAEDRLAGIIRAAHREFGTSEDFLSDTPTGDAK